MDITTARIGMRVTHPSYGEAKIYLIREDGNVSLRTVSGSNICGVGINRCDPIAPDACEFHVGDKVRAIGPSECGYTDNIGLEGEIKVVLPDGIFTCQWRNRICNNMPAGSIEHVCESCEMAATITSQCKQIAELQTALNQKRERVSDQNAELARLSEERNELKAEIHQHCRNAVYWREELEKLQKEALAECERVPLHEVAKTTIMPQFVAGNIHIAATGKVMLEELKKFSWKPKLSPEARYMVEYLTARDDPADLDVIFEDFGMDIGSALSGLSEARDAGIIQLSEGKYSLVKEE
jgi:hypothetical protein